MSQRIVLTLEVTAPFRFSGRRPFRLLSRAFSMRSRGGLWPRRRSSRCRAGRGCSRGPDLVEAAFADDTLVVGHGRLGDAQAYPRTERGYRHLLAVRHLAQARNLPVLEIGHAYPDRVPAVSVAHRPAECTVACTPDPDWRVRLADGTRSGVDVGERDELTLVRGDVLRPQCLDGREVVVSDGSSLAERDVERVELLLGPADTDAEDEPAFH